MLVNGSYPLLSAIQATDARLFHAVFSHTRHTCLPGIARIVSCTGDGWLYLSLVPAILWLRPDEAMPLLVMAMSGYSVERMLYFCLKSALRRRRPPQSLEGVHPLIQAHDEFSLPSGHTSAAFFFVTFLSAGLDPVFLSLYPWAALVGLSRVILGVHFPADILAGAVMGSALALAVL